MQLNTQLKTKIKSKWSISFQPYPYCLTLFVQH